MNIDILVKLNFGLKDYCFVFGVNRIMCYKCQKFL